MHLPMNGQVKLMLISGKLLENAVFFRFREIKTYRKAAKRRRSLNFFLHKRKKRDFFSSLAVEWKQNKSLFGEITETETELEMICLATLPWQINSSGIFHMSSACHFSHGITRHNGAARMWCMLSEQEPRHPLRLKIVHIYLKRTGCVCLRSVKIWLIVLTKETLFARASRRRLIFVDGLKLCCSAFTTFLNCKVSSETVGL